MKNPIWKETYHGQGIYWHGGNNYGDETQVWGNSMAACRLKIDRQNKARLDARPDHEKHWDTLKSAERDVWRRACIDTDFSASELAFKSRSNP